MTHNQTNSLGWTPRLSFKLCQYSVGQQCDVFIMMEISKLGSPSYTIPEKDEELRRHSMQKLHKFYNFFVKT